MDNNIELLKKLFDTSNIDKNCKCKYLFNDVDFKNFIVNFLKLTSEEQLPYIEQKVHYPIYRDYIESFVDIGEYKDSNKNKIIATIIKLKEEKSPDKARTIQRNFIAQHIEDKGADAAVVAIYSENYKVWRISFVKMEYEFSIDGLETKVTPAKRYSYLIEENSKNYTVQNQLKNILLNDTIRPTVEDIENAFSVEKVTEEFFKMYKEKYIELRELLKLDNEFKKECDRLDLNQDKLSDEFSKKLMSQIAFLYFLQKKGWLGVRIVPQKINLDEFTKIFNKYNYSKEIQTVLRKVYRIESGEAKLGGASLKLLNDVEVNLLLKVFANDENYDEPWGTGSKTFIRELFNKSKKNKNFFNDYLEPLFYSALNEKRGEYQYFKQFNCKIPFLNGGLFEPIFEYDWKSTHINIPNEVFSNENEDGILDFFDTYNFTINEDEPLEKEVAVDPEMLGKIFESLLDVNERKSKGAFYTPREIVHNMCQECLISYINVETGLSIKDLEIFIKYGEFIKDFDMRAIKTEDYKMPISILENLEKIDTALKNVKVADPSVGSGAFPLGMLSEIVKSRSIITEYISKKMNDTDAFYLKRYRNIYILKRNTMNKCIFAVDVESSAVDITKLRLWLSLVVDADETIVNPLPNLDYNIMLGNSLMEEFEGIKLFEEELLKEDKKNKEIKEVTQQMSIYQNGDEVGYGLEQQQEMLENIQILQSKLFDEEDKEKKKEIKRKINNLEWGLIEYKLKKENRKKELKRFEEMKHKNNKPYFLWRLEFSKIFQINGGFDIVIGNPPYIGEKKNSNLFQELKLCEEWRQYCSKRMNIYYCFAKKGIDILKDKGIMSYIIPYEWMTADNAYNMRKYLLEKSNIKKITHFADNFVFEGVGTSSMILETMKSNNLNDNIFKFILYDGNETKVKNILNQSISIKELKQSELDITGKRIWNISDCENHTVNNEKLIPLGDILNVQVGIQTGANRVMQSHIDMGLASKGQLGRGIFELKEGLDIIIENDKYFLNISKDNNPNFVQLDEIESRYIKCVYGGSDLNEWSKNKASSRLIYVYDLNLDKNSNIYKYLNNYKKILINRSLKKGQGIVECEDFDKFSIDDVKHVYSPAGSVQKVMRKKQWYSIMFARENINFKGPKLMTSSRAESFTYSKHEDYGLSGINYIFFDSKIGKEYQNIINNNSNKEDYLKYVNAILNSNYMTNKIKESKLNALTGSKLKQLIDIYNIDFTDKRDVEMYNNIVEYANRLIELYNEYNIDIEEIESIKNRIEILINQLYTKM